MPKAIAQTSGDKEKVPGEPPGGENRVLGNPPAIKMAKANVLGVPPGGVNMVLGNPPAASGKSKITNEPNDAAEIAKINDEVPRGSLKGHQRAIKNFLKRLDKKPWTLVTLSKTDPMTEVTITAGNGIDQIVFHFEEHEEGKLRLQRTVPSLDNCKAK